VDPHVFWWLVLWLAAVAFPCPVPASGFRILDQSASATGQGSAFAAQADDASAVYYNPAGMTQLQGVQLSLGTLLVGGHASFTNPAGVQARGDMGNNIAYPPPSNLYITANLKNLGVNALGNLTVGLGVISPFGTMSRWPQNGPFATAITRASLELLDIKPTLAYKVSDELSLGLGADIYTFASFWGEGRGETHFRSSGGPGLPPAGIPIEINGRDTTAGFNASLLYTPIRNADGKPLANVGVIYRSQAVMSLEGLLLVNGAPSANASTTFVLPQVFTGGMALWPIRNAGREWKVEIDLDYTGWKSFRNTDVQLSNGATLSFPQHWKSTYTVMAGTEYKWLQPPWLTAWEVALRGGYWYSQTPVPDSSFSPAVPDSNNHAISAGVGLLCKDGGRFLGIIECGSPKGGLLGSKAIGLDVAYQALLYETRTVAGNQNPVAVPGSVNGTYQTTYQVGSVNVRVNF
jgi:long-chain fatty acid transport protein